jgi:hypothetical protein
MKKLIKHILQEDYSRRKEDYSRRKLDMIRKYVETYTNKGLGYKVCEVLVQNDGDFLVVDIFIDDDLYKLLNDYEVFDLRMNISSRIIDTFSINRRNIIAVYVERCSSVRYRYLDQNNDEVKEPIQLKEETKAQSKLISIIKNEGFKIAADSVGGIKNLFKILNKDKKFTIQYLLSYFDDLKLEKFRDEFHLSQSYNTFLEKVPTFKGSYIRVFDDQLYYHFLKGLSYELYHKYREDLLREIISRYPELNDVNQVVIYKDRSLYNRLYTFFLNDNDNENTITESTSRKDRVILMIDDVGILQTIQSLGGIDNLKRILGNDYFTKEKKIEIISEIAAENGIRGELYLDDFDIEISLGEDIRADGSYVKTFVIYVDDNESFYFKEWEFEAWGGQMLDEPIDEGYMKLYSLVDYQIDELFNVLINKFLR